MAFAARRDSAVALAPADIDALLEGCAPVVEDLWLTDTGLTDESLAVLLRRPLPRLRGLWLHENQLTSHGVAGLRNSAVFDQLDGLSLFQNEFGAECEALLAGHALAGSLQQTARRTGVLALQFAGGLGGGVREARRGGWWRLGGCRVRRRVALRADFFVDTSMQAANLSLPPAFGLAWSGVAQW